MRGFWESKLWEGLKCVADARLLGKQALGRLELCRLMHGFRETTRFGGLEQIASVGSGVAGLLIGASPVTDWQHAITRP